MKPPKILETHRLLLRLPVLNDAEDIFLKYAQDTEVTKYLTWVPHENINTTREFLLRCTQCWINGSAFPWVVELKANNELIGMVELRLQNHNANLGYGIARPYWGNGYVAEAVKAIVAWSLAQPGIFRVWAVCDVANKGSARVLEKVGMQREGVLRRYIVHPNISNEPRDCYCYSVVK